MLKGNKGEWSEIYVLLKLLSEKELCSGNASLFRNNEQVYRIRKIIRTEPSGDITYHYSNNSDAVLIEGYTTSIPINQIKKHAGMVYRAIKTAPKGTFSVAESADFLKLMHCTVLKAKSTVKTDIRVVILDPKTQTCPELGFSIKSQLGSPSTLLNASRATNFLYKLTNPIATEQLATINAYPKMADRLNHILQHSALEFVDTESRVFRNNLVLIDSRLPDILAGLLVAFFSSTRTSLVSLTEKLRKLNPINYDLSFEHNFYAYKIKHLLTDIALGLMPTKVWTGSYDATGGYLMVMDDGAVMAYHSYNRNEFENYLYNNTRLETASTGRHKFGAIYEEGGTQLLKLNLQIRFKK